MNRKGTFFSLIFCTKTVNFNDLNNANRKKLHIFIHLFVTKPHFFQIIKTN